METLLRYIKVILPLRLDWEPCYRTGDREVGVGDRVRVLFAGRPYLGVVSAVDVVPETDPARIRPVEFVEKAFPSVSGEEIRFWRMVAEYYLCTVGEVCKAAYPSGKIEEEEVGVRREERLQARLEAWREKLGKARTDVTRERYAERVHALEEELSAVTGGPVNVCLPSLTPSQSEARSSIEALFQAGKTALLRGVTGSGKTEVYMSLAGECLAEGRSVLYLVPEIALSRQLEERIRSVFPQVLIFHSAITPARKREVAERCRKGPGALVLGTRSALFLPHRDLGLVIVDEEHDTSYKQDSPAPRYHGRDAAIMLAGIHGAHVVLGSATPSLESVYNAECGRFGLVSLDRRYYEGERPEVGIIDTRAERRKRGMVGSLSRKLLEEMGRTLEAGGQVLVLRARRSFSPVVQCASCGTVVKCPRCNVPMSLHRNGASGRLVCHYCGHSEAYSGLCGSCGGALQPLGAGTQRIEEELRELFPAVSIGRLDSDTENDAAVIRDFSAGNIQVLVGTQIVTKGFDFDRLSLVAVIHADGLLARQDFRADERALQLLEQFRGRSGRRGERGRLLIQTSEPDHPVLRCLAGAEGDVTGKMLEERRQFGYPPFTRLVGIVLRDADQGRLEMRSRELAVRLSALGVSVTGPYAPAVDRIAGEHIRHLRITLLRDKSLIRNKREIGKAVAAFEKECRYSGHIVIDVDPS